MRIEQTKTKVETVGDIVSVKTDRLIIETPDQEPAPLVVNIDVKPVLNVVEQGPAPVFDEHDFQAMARAKGYASGGIFKPESPPKATPVATARAAMEGKPQPGPWPHDETPVHFDCHQPGENLAAFTEMYPDFRNEVHFNATPGERFTFPHTGLGQPNDIPLRYAAMEPRRPNREIPLWAFARRFFVEEFTVLDPRRADILADHFMEQYRAKWKDGKGV